MRSEEGEHRRREAGPRSRAAAASLLVDARGGLAAQAHRTRGPLAGERLPSERELAETLRVGRDSIRQAIRTLNDEGLVETRLGRSGGTVVSDMPVQPKRLSEEILASHREIKASYEFRLAVEPAAASPGCAAGDRRRCREDHRHRGRAGLELPLLAQHRFAVSRRGGRSVGQRAPARRRPAHPDGVLRLVQRDLLSPAVGLPADPGPGFRVLAPAHSRGDRRRRSRAGRPAHERSARVVGAGPRGPAGRRRRPRERTPRERPADMEPDPRNGRHRERQTLDVSADRDG